MAQNGRYGAGEHEDRVASKYMNKKIIATIIVILIVLIATIVWLILKKTKNETKQPQITQEITNNANNSTQPTPSYPQEEKIILQTKNGGVEVNNFYKNIVETIGDTVFLKKEPSFNLAYFRPDGTILIALKKKPIFETRKDAEKSLLEIMGINKDAACKLNVSIEVPVSIDENYAGENLGLSFCPGN